ncbi:class I SAM-dependent methyltransferase [Streptomyces sp. NPDC002746]
MADKQYEVPDNTAVRVALWRAMHVQIDAEPHVFEDEIGLRLVAPEEDWRSRPDMDPDATSGFRASTVCRARFVEDLVAEEISQGIDQYVILGAGLDTYVQRRPGTASRLRVFEIDQPATQAWKRRRLIELGYGIPERLRLVPVDFEAGGDWWQQLSDAGFDASRPALVVCAGVTVYLTKEAIAATLRTLGGLAPGSTLAMTFMLPAGLVDDADRDRLEETKPKARASGTPFISFHTPREMLALARAAGFESARHVSGPQLAARYFADRTDGLRPSSGEDLLIATV